MIEAIWLDIAIRERKPSRHNKFRRFEKIKKYRWNALLRLKNAMHDRQMDKLLLRFK